MRIKRARQILKSLADDTRLRIVNLLSRKELNVSELCKVLGASQSNVSKHLTSLRLVNIVGDKREGLNVYYFLTKPKDKFHKELIRVVAKGLSEVEIFKKDLEVLKKQF